jgi:hypothetical protein
MRAQRSMLHRARTFFPCHAAARTVLMKKQKQTPNLQPLQQQTNKQKHSQKQELGKELVAKAYEHAARPDFLASPDYARFTPARECLAVPGDIVRTELRLVLAHGGWEYCVLKRALTASAPADSDMLVTAIEFEGRPEEAILGALGLRVSLIAYPIVALRKSFLEGVTARLRADPGSFQGLL